MIPLQRDFSITPGVISAAGTALDMTGLLLTGNDLAPTGSVQAFSTQAAVGDYFGAASDEYTAAGLYFNGYDNATTRASTLLIGRFVTDEAGASAWLVSGSFKGQPVTALQAVSGKLKLTVDGQSVTSSDINLSAVTSYDAAAAALETAIGNKVSVKWLSVQQRFRVSSVKAGADSTITFASGSAAAALKLTADSGAALSQGAAPSVVAETMDTLTRAHQNWVLFTTLFAPTTAQSLAFAAWATQQNYRFGYIAWDNTSAGTIANNPDCLAHQIMTVNGYQNVAMMYGDYRYAMTALAYAGSLNFDATHGRVSYKFRAFSGLPANVTDGTIADALASNGYTYYGRFGANNIVYHYASDGAISGAFKWLDTFLCQVWINANLLGAFATVFTQNQSFPFNEKGYTALRACVIDVAQKALNFGAIRTGITLDASQSQQVNNAVGKEISNTLYAEGWYLAIPPQSATNRTERKLTGAVFFYTDGSLIQHIRLASLDVM
ncbi:hypothetical protein SGGMMB4_01758 [Sodalis glossinidius str. 'morsitans']|uniref:DUF3383 domain-containing protein n=1 Tax=Sodalis glossinidius (strain morsitans) TaxID=343509 RepID=Q2NUZ4_SODGM|nr:DUF3383 family protein [Sodalis glossinidius]BAE74031.1 conserved hypothetical protein [Sodalis glossinidius str. 'morsitans']CRL44584.1 hypothetical protein SGGMMB4_01758 [Sodalis glossinidius str. 'morsitans']